MFICRTPFLLYQETSFQRYCCEAGKERRYVTAGNSKKDRIDTRRYVHEKERKFCNSSRRCH